jgi:hypothetical protein
MKIIIYDVANASCALVVCPNGNSLMIDCGSHSEKQCPVDDILLRRKHGNWLSEMKDYKTNDGVSYPLTKLLISHPDLDHIDNSAKVKTSLTPYLLCRRYLSDFPSGIIDVSIDGVKTYKKEFCDVYTGNNPETPDWGFDKEMLFNIPMKILNSETVFEKSKIKNNSSYIKLLEYKNRRILFAGDMEEAGWEWLIKNNPNGFRDEISKGIDILIASHHGHVSGYSKKLFELMGAPQLSILSKGSEAGEDTDVSSSYSQNSSGLVVKFLNSGDSKRKYTLTTRSNGKVYINVDENENLYVFADKAS